MQFIGTRRIRGQRYTTPKGGMKEHLHLFIDSLWGFQPGDIINLTIKDAKDPDAHTHIAIRKVLKAGSSVKVTIPAYWGLSANQWVNYTVDLVERSPTAPLEEEEMDTGAL